MKFTRALVIFWAFNWFRWFLVSSPIPQLQTVGALMPEDVCVEMTWDSAGHPTSQVLPDSACAGLPK